MATLYKVYLIMVVEKIKIECDEKNVILQNQTGFGKNMDTTYIS